MPQDAEETAQALLAHLIEIAPAGSDNMTLAISRYKIFREKLQNYNQKVLESKNKYHFSYWSHSAKQERELLKSELIELARELKMGYSPELNLFCRVPFLNYEGRYERWYKQASAACYSSPSECHDLHDSLAESLCADYGALLGTIPALRQYETLFALERMIEYIGYQIVRGRQAGTCGELAKAGMYHLLSESEYSGHVHLIIGKNVDHAVIILCEQELPSTFTLDKLSAQYPDARIVDPWLRCHFLAKNASEYYEILHLLRHNDKEGPYEFKVHTHLGPEKLKKAKAFYDEVDLEIRFDAKIAEAIATLKSKKKLDS